MKPDPAALGGKLGASSRALPGDGGGASRYLVYAVASDRLGNPSLNRDRRSCTFNASGYPFVIVNVDNTAPTVTAPTLRDRGPLDVNAQGEGCERVDALEAPLAAPSDVFPAEEGFASSRALVSASVADSGVGFDSARVVNTRGTLIGLGTPQARSPLFVFAAGSPHSSRPAWRLAEYSRWGCSRRSRVPVRSPRVR